MKYIINFLLLTSGSWAFANSECVFDDSAFNESWIENKQHLNNYIWDQESKQFGIVLSGNRFLSISGGGCEHYGESYLLTVVNATYLDRTEKWYRDNLLNLAGKILDTAELKLFTDQLSKVKIPSQLEPGAGIGIEAEAWESFGIIIRDNITVVEFEISWYQN